MSKLFMGDWSAQSYLSNVTGFLSGFYHWLAGGETLIRVVDFMNIYGLIVIGLALFIGLFIRAASVAGIALPTRSMCPWPKGRSSSTWS